MLANATVHPTLPAIDMKRAREFWEGTVGLTPVDVGEDGVWYRPGGDSTLFLFPSAGAASGTHTQVAFRVDDMEQEVASLRDKGITFEEYDIAGLKTVNGIADVGPDRAAWFRDSEGNMIGVIQTSKAIEGVG